MQHHFLINKLSAQNDLQMVATIRFVMAFLALLIIFINRGEPDRNVVQTYSTLIFYVLYSTLIFLCIKYSSKFFERVLRFLHWADVAWYLLLISLSSGTSSNFFFCFYFVVLYTSFLYGFSEGLKVTLFSAFSFILIGYFVSPPNSALEFDRFLLRPLYLIVIGYMMAHWGGYEIRTKRRLALLRDIVALSNPRFGVDRTLGTSTELLRSFYDSDGCLLIMNNSEADSYVVRRAERNNPENALQTHVLKFETAQNLIPLPENYAAVYEKSRHGIGRRFRRFYVCELPDKNNLKEYLEFYERIAEKLETNSFLTVPVYYRNQAVGRVFIFSNQANVFDSSDIDFLLQLINQFMPIVENIRLVDHLASSAADEERKKIARDIHDSIIQPYIGLQLGIESVINILDTKSDDRADDSKKAEIIKTRINRLKDLTEKGIEDLRGYINNLSNRRDFETNLLPAIRSYTEKFSNATGIPIEIKAEDHIQINDRLAAEIFQIVAEALSNVRRHTQSPSACIDLTTDKDKLILAIENNIIDNVITNFTPQSILERVKSLGGSLEVKQENKMTIIRVEIPL
jgi:signal transduction histidine kinase